MDTVKTGQKATRKISPKNVINKVHPVYQKQLTPKTRLKNRDSTILLVRVQSGSPVIKKARGTTLAFFITGPEGKIFTRRKFFPKGQVLTPYGILKPCGTSISYNATTKRSILA